MLIYLVTLDQRYDIEGGPVGDAIYPDRPVVRGETNGLSVNSVRAALSTQYCRPRKHRPQAKSGFFTPESEM